MSNIDATVDNFRAERRPVTAAILPSLRTLFGLESLPLADTRVRVEIGGADVPTAVINALRRVVVDEMRGRCLRVPPGGFDSLATTDVFMLPQLVNQCISFVPLRPQISASVIETLRLGLVVENTTSAVRTFYTGDMQVEAGALPPGEPIFNPTFGLGFLQPGKRIEIHGIHIVEGAGRDNASFMVGRRGAYTHLDIPQHDRSTTHPPGGSEQDNSGYKVSCLVADPRRHELRVTLAATTAATAEVRAVFVDACEHVKERLRLVAAVLEQSRDETAMRRGDGVQFTTMTHASGLNEGTLVVPGETATIGELLRRAVYDRHPGISNVSQQVVAHKGVLTVEVRDAGDPHAILRDAVEYSIAVFDTIQRGFATVKIQSV